MKSHIWLMVAGLLLAAGCNEPAPAAPDRPVDVKPTAASQVMAEGRPAEESALTMPEFVEVRTPQFQLRKRPVFDGLVRFEQGCANIEAYMIPLKPRLRIDWKFLTENTREMDLGLLSAMNDHLDTALDQSPKGGAVPVFGSEFHLDLVRLHEVARQLYWASEARDLTNARRFYRALRVQLGPRLAVQGQAAGEKRNVQAVEVDTSTDDSLIKGKDEKYGDLSKLKLRTNIRAEYPFWPAPVSVKSEFLAADPKPVVLNWAMNMDHSYDFDQPHWPQPAMINTRDLHQENEYTERISTVEVR